jgi:hypothetical protein
VEGGRPSIQADLTRGRTLQFVWYTCYEFWNLEWIRGKGSTPGVEGNWHDSLSGHMAFACHRRQFVILSHMPGMGENPARDGSKRTDGSSSRRSQLFNGWRLRLLQAPSVCVKPGKQRYRDVWSGRKHDLPMAASAQIFAALRETQESIGGLGKEVARGLLKREVPSPVSELPSASPPAIQCPRRINSWKVVFPLSLVPLLLSAFAHVRLATLFCLMGNSQENQFGAVCEPLSGLLHKSFWCLMNILRLRRQQDKHPFPIDSLA